MPIKQKKKPKRDRLLLLLQQRDQQQHSPLGRVARLQRRDPEVLLLSLQGQQLGSVLSLSCLTICFHHGMSALDLPLLLRQAVSSCQELSAYGSCQ